MGRKKLSTRRLKRKRCEKGGEEPGEGSSVTPDSIAPDSTPLAHESIAPDSIAPDSTPLAHESIAPDSTVIVKYTGDVVPLDDFDPSVNVSGDDCEVMGDEDCDDVGYLEDGSRVGLEEGFCQDFEAEFGEGARERKDETDNDSGVDIFDDEKIPDPMSESEDEDDVRGDEHVEVEDPEVLLHLGKTYSSTDEFKVAVLRYSLKTIYDIKLYRSQALKIGAKCAATDVKCPWRCYCSYDRKKHKMQIKVYEATHVCVRSGYSHMLKRGTIAWLYADRLRKDPKIRPKEMAAEIKREYNLEVSEEQCSKAKSYGCNLDAIINTKSIKQEPRTSLFGQGQTWEGSQASQGGSQPLSEGGSQPLPQGSSQPASQPAQQAPQRQQGVGGWRSWF